MAVSNKEHNNKNNLNYADFQAFLVQYETLMPDLVSSDFLLADRISALNELIKQNNELLAASVKSHFVPAELIKIARPASEVQAVLHESHAFLTDILLNLTHEPRSKFQYR
jgi:hypothetical protein